jgi:hypothetical protein
MKMLKSANLKQASALLILTLTAQGACPVTAHAAGFPDAAVAENAAGPGSLHSRREIAAMIARYIELHRVWTRSLSAPERLQAAADFDAALHSQALEIQVDRVAADLAGEINRLDSDPTFARRLRDQAAAMGRRAIGIRDEVARRDAGTYNETVANLVADYYENPGNRDADYALLAELAEVAEPQARAARDHTLYRSVWQGTMLAWSILAVWEWRGGGQGLASDARTVASGIGRGSRWLVERLRGGAARELESHATSVIPALERTGTQGSPEAAGAALGRLMARLGPGERQPVSKGMAEGLRKLGSGLAKSFVLGGVPYALFHLNEESAGERADPQALVEVMQAWAIVELEAKVLELRSRMDARLRVLLAPTAAAAEIRALKADVPALERNLTSFLAQARDLQAEYDHFDRHASRFKANYPVVSVLPDIRKELRARQAAASLPTQARAREFARGNRELHRLLSAAQAELRAQARRAGFQSEADLNVSLYPIEVGLSAIALQLASAQAQLADAKALSASDLVALRTAP